MRIAEEPSNIPKWPLIITVVISIIIHFNFLLLHYHHYSPHLTYHYPHNNSSDIPRVHSYIAQQLQ